MKHKYTIIPELGLVIQQHSGLLNANDLLNLKTQITKDPAFSEDFVFLVELKDTQIDMTVEELIAHEEWISNHPQLSKVEKFAILTETPAQVETSFQYIQNAGLRIDHYMIFRTPSSALEWLNIDKKQNELVVHELSQ